MEKRISMHPRKPHATCQPSRYSHTHRLSTGLVRSDRNDGIGASWNAIADDEVAVIEFSALTCECIRFTV